MRNRLLLTLVGMAAMTGLVMAQGTSQRLNPVIELLEQKKPVFGLYAPSNRRPGRPGGPGGAPGSAGGTAAPEAPPKSPTELAKEAVAYKSSDFVFDGSMEGGLERALPAFTALMSGHAGRRRAHQVAASSDASAHRQDAGARRADDPRRHRAAARSWASAG